MVSNRQARRVDARALRSRRADDERRALPIELRLPANDDEPIKLPTTMMKREWDTLLCELATPQVLVVTLNRPEVANALNTKMGQELYELFKAFLLDIGELRCIVLTAAGTKVFCAGGDLKERNTMDDASWRRQHAIFEQAFYAMMDCPIPLIAAVNGAAYGGGCELALACDFIIATQNTKFALPETRLGLIPGAGGTQNLARAIGQRRAKELIFSASPFSAEQAHEWGMVNHLTTQETLLDSALKHAGRISANAPIAVRQAKRAIAVGTETDIKTGLAIEVEAYNRLVPTADRREGVLAFNQKRDPVFSGQ